MPRVATNVITSEPPGFFRQTPSRALKAEQSLEGYLILEKLKRRVHTPDIGNRQIVVDLLQRIPEDASLHKTAREIEFIAAVRQGLTELDRGEHIPIEEVERELPSWIIR